MVVGQDFNSVAAYNRALALGSEIDVSPTWRNLRTVLAAANIPMEQCFFTNVYMGLRAVGRETGRFPGCRDKSYVSRCMAFLDRQMALARPKMILTLGLEPLRVIGTVFNVIVPKSLAACAQVYGPVLLPHGQTVLVALTHPSLYHANVHRRRYRGLIGAKAEQAMLQAGLAEAFPSAVMF